MVKAYSYVRFSSPEQMSGDSLRRQTALAEAYADEFGLVLDSELTYRDLGVSSFRSQNATSGRLGAFLAAACSGAVPVGSVLLVENLDRLSRDHALVAQNLLTQIVMAGVSVVTLSDRREYSLAELKRDPMGLLFALINFIRANEESELKSTRMKAVWAAKRSKIGAGPLTAQCPAWLRLDPKTRKFVRHPQRVSIVRKVYSLASRGAPLSAIARTLTSAQAPRWRKQGEWTNNSVARLLENVAVVGTFTPHRYTWENGRTIRVPCDPVPNYFPAIIEPDLFRNVQELRLQAGRGERGRHSNIVNLLACCSECGSSMLRMRHGAEASRILVCSAARAGLGCTYREVSYALVEASLRSRLASILLTVDASAPRDGISDQLSKAQNAVDRARRRMSAAYKRQYGSDPAVDATAALVRDQEALELQMAIDEAEEHLLETVESCQPKMTKVISAKIAHALECLQAPDASSIDTMALNAALRAVFVKAEIDPAAKRIGLRRMDHEVVWIDMG